MTETVAPYLVPVASAPTHLVDAADFKSEWCQPNALHLPPGLPSLQWLGVGEFIETTAEWTPFARGYWWLYGGREYGEPRRTQLLEWVREIYPDSALARKRKTYVNYGRVIRAFDPFPTPGHCLEHGNFWWYEAALGLPEGERETFLEACAEHNLSSRQARALANGRYEKEEVSETEVASLVNQNGRLKETARDLHATVDVLREENKELAARNRDLERELEEARQRIQEEAEEQCAEPWATADEAYQRDRDEEGAEEEARWAMCPRCGKGFWA